MYNNNNNNRRAGPRAKSANMCTIYYYIVCFGLFQRTRDDVTTMTLCESSEEKASPTKLTGKFVHEYRTYIILIILI